MADLLGLLDVALEDLEREASSRCSRSSRSHREVDSRSGTSNPLKRMLVPAVPVIPAQKPECYVSITDRANVVSKHWQEGRAREYHLNRLGTTGRTGTDEAFCGFPVPNRRKENGNEREHVNRDTRTTENQKAALLVNPSAVWDEAEEERAAIVEHDGKIPRSWAEGFARLHPDRPPGDVPVKRWTQFINDVGRFLDSSFGSIAAACGWESFDLFGCDAARPFARIDRAGLLWLLNGCKLVEITEATATIETRTGKRQTWRRKPVDPGRVLAWEIAP
jgi:hypothetical protein